MDSVREDAPNLQETGDPRVWGDLVAWGLGVGVVKTDSWRQREKVWNVEQSEGGWRWGGNKIWSVKNKLI